MRPPAPLADWGTGSGVLAIAAAKLGWSPVTGCDRELASLETAQANAEANGVEMSIERIDVREGPPPVAPTVVANLTAQPAQATAPATWPPPASAPNGSSAPGCWRRRSTRWPRPSLSAGWPRAERRIEGDWGALLLRPGPAA